jgi:hypothetical protein
VKNQTSVKNQNSEKNVLEELLLKKRERLVELNTELPLLNEQISILEKEISNPKKVNLQRIGTYQNGLKIVSREDFFGTENLKIDKDLLVIIKRKFDADSRKTIRVERKERIVVRNTETVSAASMFFISRAELITIEEIIVTIYDLIAKEKADQGPLYNFDFSVSKSLHIGFVKHEEYICDVWISRKRHGHSPGTLGREFIVHWEKDLSWVYYPNTESLI